MTKRFLLLSRTWWQGRNRVCAKLQRTLCGLSVLVVSSCGGGGGGATAPPPKPPTGTAETLYSFGGTSTDAMGPSGVLFQGSDGNFYGTTDRGGLARCANGAATSDPFVIGCGTVFKITPTGEETVLHLFAAAPADGARPSVLIQGSDGNFYGTTAIGGANNAGAVFKLTPEGVETILYSFTGGSDGTYADGLVQGRDGNFYGTTSGGSTTFGTVFKVTPQGVETTLYTFSGSSPSNGATPTNALTQGTDGNFYGTTLNGGINEGGTMFQLTPGGVVTVLYSFPNTSGPNTNLVQGSDGNFYGGTERNGAYNRGYFFKLILN